MKRTLALTILCSLPLVAGAPTQAEIESVTQPASVVWRDVPSFSSLYCAIHDELVGSSEVLTLFKKLYVPFLQGCPMGLYTQNRAELARACDALPNEKKESVQELLKKLDAVVAAITIASRKNQTHFLFADKLLAAPGTYAVLGALLGGAGGFGIASCYGEQANPAYTMSGALVLSALSYCFADSCLPKLCTVEGVATDPRSAIVGMSEARAVIDEIVMQRQDSDGCGQLGVTPMRSVLLFGESGSGKTMTAKVCAEALRYPFISLDISAADSEMVYATFRSIAQRKHGVICIDYSDVVNTHTRKAMLDVLKCIATQGYGSDIILFLTAQRGQAQDSLLHSGLLDRVIYLTDPVCHEREELLRDSARYVLLADDVDIRRLALHTEGWNRAHIMQLFNRAGRFAARAGRSEITMDDCHQVYEMHVLGSERRKDARFSRKMLWKTAVHEAGHAIMMLLAPSTFELDRVSIEAAGRAAGVTYNVISSDDDSVFSDEDDYRNQIAMSLGAGVAERLFFGSHTNGVASDYRCSYELAREMVTLAGFSSLGASACCPYGMMSESLKAQVHAEMQRIINECEQKAIELLTAHKDAVEKLAQALMEKVTLSREEVLEVTGLG